MILLRYIKDFLECGVVGELAGCSKQRSLLRNGFLEQRRMLNSS